MPAPEGSYRTSTPRPPEPPRPPWDARITLGIVLGVAAVLLALAALSIALATGLFAEPSATMWVPVFVSSLCALKGVAVARRLWRNRRRVIATVVTVLAVMAFAGDALAVTDFLTHERLPPPPPPSAGGWTFWRC
jgi:hypothetical protein